MLLPRDWPVVIRERFIERTSDRTVGELRELIWRAEKMDRREPEPMTPDAQRRALDLRSATLRVEGGKGKKDRLLPLSERASFSPIPTTSINGSDPPPAVPGDRLGPGRALRRDLRDTRGRRG